MAITNLSISTGTLLDTARFAAPYYGVVCALSQILNGILFLVTVRSPHLRTNCNRLIGLQAISEMVFAWFYPYFAYNVYTERFVTNSQCFVVMIVPIAGANMTHFMILIIGLDRYLCAVHAIWYKSIPRRHYFGVYAIIAVVIHVTTISAQYFSRTDDKVLCFIPEAFSESIIAECCSASVAIRD
ncbi:hypothetical protein QR680_014766 [Steinernema hermaphroditum]|uniref:G-protein coupled receptors family 1 profile domain-containing protein n=1 Tax=Steinernema hermaphroditum TaxID=289476 RepID=A0AA39M3S3_9BILA|nr:hypothetical protein QR680_014766 [Steinernema hermaphroditum]